MAYDMDKSITSENVFHNESILLYGSAEVAGSLWNDYVCLEKLKKEFDERPYVPCRNTRNGVCRSRPHALL